MKKEEFLPLVNDKGKVIGKASRSECHKDKKLLHPVVHLHIFNKKGDIYLQKRPKYKLVQPEKWDTAVGGHVSFNETIEIALKKETREELNIHEIDSELFQTYIWESEIERELVYLFVAEYNKKIMINKQELDEGKFWKKTEIQNNLGKNIFTQNFEFEYKTFLQK